MSSFAPSSSPLHQTEGIGQGAISDISQRHTSRATSIHILDDDSLLNMFYFYRPPVTVMDEDESFEDARISITRGRRWATEHWWYNPAHVCRRWRNLVFGSASFLGLCLVCTFNRPVAEMLAHSPPFPLVIDYLDEGSNIAAEDEEGISLALEQSRRIRCIRLGLSGLDLQKFAMAIDDELPVLEYLVLVTGRMDDTTLVFPETIQAPHLRHLVLMGVAPPIGSRLLTTAMGIVTLCLFMDSSSTYLNPNHLLQWISLLPQLETLVITSFPDRLAEMQLLYMPTITYATFPNLRLLSFQGASAFLEVLVCQIATPRLERFHIVFYEHSAFSIPCLAQFMDTTENQKLRFDHAKFGFSEGRLRVETYLHEENRRCSFSVSAFFTSVDNSQVDGNISSMAKIVDELGQAFSAVEHLILEHEEPEDGWSSEEDSVDVDDTEWHKLLRPFCNVKNLHVKYGLIEDFSRYLLMNHGVLPSEILPKLQELTYSGSVIAGGGFTSFVDARQKDGHPVSLVRRSPSPSPSLTSDQVRIEREFWLDESD